MKVSKLIALHLETTVRNLSDDDYKRWNPAVWQLHDDTTELLSSLSVDSLLDVGAGTRNYQRLQTAIATDCIWLDRYPRTCHLDLWSDAMKLGLSNNSVDMVFSAQVLEHLPEPKLALSEMARVTKPGGFVFVSIPVTGYLHNLPHDYYRFTEFGLRHLASSVGLKVITTVNSGGLFCFLGYIRSTILCPGFALPVVGRLIFTLNRTLSRLDRQLDTWTNTKTWCPVHCLMLAQKT